MALALAAIGAATIPPAGQAAGPPSGGGGCNMVAGAEHSSTGIVQMMVGSANGNGAQKMGAMLSKFSSQQFCGLA